MKTYVPSHVSIGFISICKLSIYREALMSLSRKECSSEPGLCRISFSVLFDSCFFSLLFFKALVSFWELGYSHLMSVFAELLFSRYQSLDSQFTPIILVYVFLSLKWLLIISLSSILISAFSHFTQFNQALSSIKKHLSGRWMFIFYPRLSSGWIQAHFPFQLMHKDKLKLTCAVKGYNDFLPPSSMSCPYIVSISVHNSKCHPWLLWISVHSICKTGSNIFIFIEEGRER